MTRVLIIEDDTGIGSLARDYCEAQGWQVVWIQDGTDFKDTFDPYYNAVVLDLMLPSINGLELCTLIRAQSDVPILMTTAKVEEVDRLQGLELGADDYLCKPYSFKELIARIQAQTRRYQVPSKYAFTLDKFSLQVRFNHQSISLTKVEFLLLQHLVDHCGRVFSRDEIMDVIYSDRRVVSDRTVDSHVKKIRQKLISYNLPQPVSVYGAGYKFEW